MLLEGESFRMGTFGRLVFCEARTQIVGKTLFFDSLMNISYSIPANMSIYLGDIFCQKCDMMGFWRLLTLHERKTFFSFVQTILCFAMQKY